MHNTWGLSSYSVNNAKETVKKHSNSFSQLTKVINFLRIVN